MRLSQRIYKLLIITTLSLIVSACGGGGNSSSGTSDINTLNIYFEDSQIIAYYPSSATTRVLAETDPGPNTAFAMNTDDEAQGFEYAVYTRDGVIYLLDYITGRSSDLATIDETICGIFPNNSHSNNAFLESNEFQESYFSNSSMFIVVPDSSGICANDSVDVWVFDYALDSSEEDSGNVELYETSTSRIFGNLLFDPRFEDVTFDAERNRIVDRGRSIFLGYDIDGRELELYDDETLIAQASFPAPVDQIPVVFQTTYNEAVVINDRSVYVLDVNNLISATNTSEPSGSAIDVTSLSSLVETPTPIEQLVGDPSDTLDTTDIEIFRGRETFVLRDDTTLRKLKANSTPNSYSLIPIYTLDLDEYDIDVVVSEGENIFLIKSFDDRQVLSWLSPSSADADVFVETTLLTASIIDLQSIEREVYINTFEARDASNNIFTGWQAQYSTLDRLAVTSSVDKISPINDSQFLFLRDLRDETTQVMIIQSLESTAAAELEEASLKAFDINNGDDFEQPNEETVLGTFCDPVNITFGNDIVNDRYGLIQSQANDDVISLYYFDPSDTKDESLQLIGTTCETE